MRKKVVWRLMGMALLIAVLFIFESKFDWFSVRADAGQSSSLEQLEAELAGQFTNRADHFTVQYVGNKQELSDNLKDVIKEALTHDDYTAYVLESFVYTIRSMGNRSTIKLDVKYRETKEQTAEVDRIVQRTIAQIIKPAMNDHEKVKVIHDWIVNKLEYDQSLTKYTAYEALTTGEAVCQGYSLLGYAMLREAGITVNIAEGTVNTGAHAWNMVKLDGKWYHLDLTWDDPVTTKAVKQSRPISYSYYLKTDKQLRVDHTWVKSYPTATRSYSDELKQLALAGDKTEAKLYNKLLTELGLHWLEPSNTVDSVKALSDLLKREVKRKTPTVQFRYKNGDQFSTDLKAAFETVNSPFGYEASYEPYSNDGSMLVHIKLSYR